MRADSLIARKRPIDLPEKVAFLSDPAHYREPTARVEAVETHMSWVFLTDNFAYKLKKPVRTHFLDFSTLAARRHFCEEEVRLNRRLAQNIYLDVSVLCETDIGDLFLDGPGTPVDWLVKMHRLPREQMLDFLLYKGAIGELEIHRFMRVLIDFYRTARPVHLPARDYKQRLMRDVDANHAAIADRRYAIDREQRAAIHARQKQFLTDPFDWLKRRATDKRIIEAHGDLRPEHVCLTTTPVFIDCLEFKREFRLMDPLHELAYLAMECDHLKAPFVDPIVFQAYYAGTGDSAPRPLVEFYKSERAILRVKLALWHLHHHASDENRMWTSRARHYLDLASSYCERF